jgi:hypothetical protein
LHFGHPSFDACKFCDEWAMKIEAASTSDKNSRLKGEQELYLQVVHSAG